MAILTLLCSVFVPGPPSSFGRGAQVIRAAGSYFDANLSEKRATIVVPAASGFGSGSG
jgi:hypothetical protein